jgi:hypothetical protein
MTKNTTGKTDENGNLSFRGFYGNYEIIITKPDGTKQTIYFHLKEQENNNQAFKL